ncbi:hypothetical protein JA9_001681 [Meyerozyma sp. JA9]|nr:hypothetical protein JA9_001681 [Meyerozyma sp. JA9]
MGAAYTIFGKQVPSHILSLLTLGSVAGVVAWPRSKSEPAATPAPVAAAASNKEEDFDLEKFIK